MISEGTRALLHLADKPGMGAVALRKHVEECQRGSEPSLNRLDTKRTTWIESSATDESGPTKKARANEILDNCLREGISIVSALDDFFPPLLRLVKDYPPIIYVKGDLQALTGIGCAVVGTREASRLGSSWARQISEILAANGFSIVSGLALGIDMAAHEGALRGSGRTVAILAHGLDKVTPSSNRHLADDIIASGGCWMSEHPPGVPPRKAEYVRRNRLQSGMSVCSIVVESGRQGGAIHQARFTVEQGRQLFTVLPSPNTPGEDEFNRDGPMLLVEEMHARVLGSRDDLMKLIHGSFFTTNYDALLSRATAEVRLV